MWFEDNDPINTPMVGDFNNDGFDDIAYLGWCNTPAYKTFRIHLNNENGAFTTSCFNADLWFEDEGRKNTPISGDFNNDGFTDITYFGKCSNDNLDCWRMHLNNQNGSFMTTSYGNNMWFEGNDETNIPLEGDFNKDGYTDLGYFGKCGNNNSDCWRIHINKSQCRILSMQWLPLNQTGSTIIVNTQNTPNIDLEINNRCGTTTIPIQLPTSSPLNGGFPSITCNNVFSPNNDGYNDFFNLADNTVSANHTPAYNATEFEFLVFNRWGALVAEIFELTSSGFVNETIPNWNGKATKSVTYGWFDRNILGKKNSEAGEPLSEGTYFYVFKLENCNTSMADVCSGDVMILR